MTKTEACDSFEPCHGNYACSIHAASTLGTMEHTLAQPPVTDDNIRALRDESRAVGDRVVVNACNAALGLPTSDGAGGLVDGRAARTRCEARIRHNWLCGLSTYGAKP